AIERERIASAPGVTDGHAMRVGCAAGAHVERPGAAGLGEKLLAVIEDVVDGCLDGFGRGFLFYDGNHGQLPFYSRGHAWSEDRYRPTLPSIQCRLSDAGS